MATGGFETSLALTLVYEGGWSNNPADPGGATMCGITQRVYDEDRDARRLPRQGVRLSTAAERAAIYRARYWAMPRCDELPAGVDYAVFDFAVNSGVGRAVKTLQTIVGADADGTAGPRTLAAAQRYCAQHGATALTDALCVARDNWLHTLPTYATFGRGWTRRVMGRWLGAQSSDSGVIDRAFNMASGRVPDTPNVPMVTEKTYARAA